MELWLDGGHNQQGGEVLAKWIAEQSKNKKIYLVCGMIKGKDIKGFINNFAEYITLLTAVTITNEATSQSSDYVSLVAKELKVEAISSPSVELALKTISEHVKVNGNQPALVCICGSLYLAGRVLEVK
jgi:dihydrofolate synthase/folylpolyglutamate synthase